MDKSGIWVLTIFRHFYGVVTLQRYDRAMLEQRIEQQFIDSADLKYQAAQVLSKPMAAAIQSILVSVTGGGKVLACGNGGSGALAQLFAATFVGHHERERPELGAIALNTDAVTCCWWCLPAVRQTTYCKRYARRTSANCRSWL